MTRARTIAALLATLVLAGCAGGDRPALSTEQRAALTEEMLEPDQLNTGFIPAPAAPSLP